jgi:thioredoxin reductase (NADPH)
VLQEKAKADEKFNFKWESIPVEIMGKTQVEAVKIKNVRTGQEEVLPCDGVFVFIGFSPDTAFLKGFVDLNHEGYIITDEDLMSSCPGIFASGDCRERPLKQVVTACSDGAVAAYSVYRFLENKI